MSAEEPASFDFLVFHELVLAVEGGQPTDPAEGGARVPKEIVQNVPLDDQTLARGGGQIRISEFSETVRPVSPPGHDIAFTFDPDPFLINTECQGVGPRCCGW